MLEILAYVAGALVLFAAVLLLLAIRKPTSFSVARSIDIAAPPERIFPLINDLKTLNTWNPFNADPAIKSNYVGPAAGPGAAYNFASPRSGTGRFEVTDVVEPSHVGARLVMTRPMACDNRVEYRLAQAGPNTTVTWSMSGRSSLMARMMCVFMNPDDMCGKMFDKGLADLKSLAESKRQAA